MISHKDIIACICEGNTEKNIIEILLERENLKFDKNQLLDEKILTGRYRNPSIFTSQYLTMDFQGDKLVVLLIQDSQSSSYPIKPSYTHQIKGKFLVITSPEIEMLMIHSMGFYNEFQKVKSKTKPSTFLAGELGIRERELKKREFIRNFYNKYDIIEAIKTHKEKSSKFKKKDHIFLYDILKGSL